MKKRMIALLLCLSLLLCTGVSMQAETVEKMDGVKEVQSVMPREEAKRALNLFSSKVDEVEGLSETGVSRSMSGIKILYDFADNPYILIECAPRDISFTTRNRVNL